ncbi:MAG TPA: VanZ family protein, partial [Terriglobales bacterium]|nr:VanZ family protein [Terriglobales bacterium]
MKAQERPNSTFWKAWLAAILWLGLIAFESTNALSAEKTGHFLYPVLHFLFGLDPVRFLTWHFVLRKTGHIIGYSMLSLLFFRAWRATIHVTGSPRWSIVWAGIAFTMTALVASLDEWHQTFLPSRTGTIRDVALDSAAALLTQVLIYAWLRGGRDQYPSLPQR